ncbi:Unknown protein [Striga hermonthica]|uniref:Uncharacterized protein n=1 Tax=Striga hermonthica TaxID=68872 RepID=A0A9N7R5J4_STRHE|nr:Unknown protein [Striga hermonthica]
MDLRSLKRRELQALCKKHKIPANLSNLEMVKRLADFFEEKGQVNEQEENVSEIESIDVVRDRVVKKVRFSPEHELIEFTRSHGMKQRHRRSFVSVKESASSVEHGDIGHMGSQCVNGNGRVTRSRGSTLLEGQQVNEKKRGRKGVKCNEQINNGSVVESVNEDKLGEGNAESSRRVLRTRRHKLAEDVENAQKVGKPKNKMGNGKALDDASDEKSVKENVEGPGRLARSKRQKLSGASGKNTVIVESVAETIGNSVLLDSAELDDDKVLTRCFSRKRGVMAGCEDMKTDGKNGDEILENRKMSEAQNMIEPQILLRRSRRNVDKVGASVGEIRMAEPIKPEVRRSKRRESVIPPHENARNSELTVETKKTKQPRSSAPQLVIAGRVSKNEKEVPQPSEVMRRSRRKVVETCETENHLTEEYPVENGSSSVEKNMGRSRRIASISNSVGIKDDTSKGPVIPQKNEARKRKKGPSLEAGAVKTTKPRSRKLPVKESRNEKTVSILENQLCSPDGADSMRDSSSRGEMINTNMTSHVSQMSGRSTRIEKSSAGSAKNSHVEISDGNKSANSKDSGKQTSASNIKDNAEKFDSLECDVIIEKTATSMERYQSEAQLSGQIKGSSCLNMTSGQMLQEGSIVSRNEGYAEISPSTDNVLLRNQTDVNNSLEVIEAEADKHTTPGSVVVDHAGEVEGIYVEKNLESFGNGEMNLISPPIAYLEDNKQHIDASNRSYKSNNEDGSSKAGEVGPSDSCVSGRCIDHIQSKLAIQVKDPSSSKSRSIESNHAETEKSGCLQGNLTAEIEDDEFSVSHLFGSERSATINLEDGGIGSGEFSAMESDERDIDKESLVVSPMTTCVELPSICIQRDVEADHTAKTDDVGSPNSHNRKCNEDKEVIISDILCVERRDTILPQDGDIICNEMSIGESVDKGHENELSGCEAKADQIAEGDEPCLCKDNQSEPAENNDGGCLENNKYERDDGFEFRLSTLFDSGKIVRDTPQARGIMPVEQVVLDEVPVASTTMNEVKINSGCLSLKEIDPQPISSSLSLGSGQIISEPCEIIDKEADCALVLEEGVCSLGNNICGDELLVHEKSICDRNPEIGSPPDAHTMEYIPKIEEQLKGLPVVPTAINETNEDAVNDEIFGYTKDVAADACVANDGTASKLLAESVCEMEFHHAENTAKTDYGGSPNSHNKKCDEEFVISDILGVERKDMILPQDGDIIYDEMSIEDSDDKGLEIELIGCEAEADQIAEGDEPCVCKDNQSEPSENRRCLANNKYERDDNWEFGLSSLFDSGKNVTDTPQARGIMFVERMVLDEVPAASTTIDEVKINSGSLSLKEIGPQPISSSVSPGSGQIISEPCEIIDKESDCALILEKGVCSFGNNICGDEMSVHEKSVCDTNPAIVGPRDAHTKEYMPKREQQLKSLPVVPTAINETNEGDARVANDATPSKLLAESVSELEFHQAENTEQQSENLHENHTISDVGEKPSDVVSTSQRWAG